MLKKRFTKSHVQKLGLNGANVGDTRLSVEDRGDLKKMNFKIC